MGIKLSTAPPPERTRERTYDEAIVEAAKAIMDPESEVHGAEITAADDVLAPVGSPTWEKSAKNEAGSLAHYLRTKYADELAERGLRVGTKYVKGSHVWVGVMPDPKASEGGETPPTPDEGSEGSDGQNAAAA